MITVIFLLFIFACAVAGFVISVRSKRAKVTATIPEVAASDPQRGGRTTGSGDD